MQPWFHVTKMPEYDCGILDKYAATVRRDVCDENLNSVKISFICLTFIYIEWISTNVQEFAGRWGTQCQTI